MSKCSICEIALSKYKCSTCSTPYCSLACYKTHQAAHTSNDKPLPQPETPIIDQSNSTQPSPAIDPLAALATSPRLAYLFKQYPQLRGQLRSIYKSTQDPAERGGAAALLDRDVANWRQDRADENAVKCIREARQSSGDRYGEGIREFAALVLDIQQKAAAGMTDV